jgi:hypothetical protein
MSKVRDISGLANIIKVDTSGNVSFVSGSTTLATINTSGQLSGSSPVLSSSYALNADLLDGLDSTQFTLTSSFAAQTASFTAFTASVNSFTASQLVLNGTYTTTGSNTFAGIQTINSNLVVTGSITAQTLVVQTITSSVDFVTGSTRFGSLLDNTHVFSGSVSMNPGGLFVSSSGFTGIGTTTPNQLLTIIGSGSTAAATVSTVSNHASFFEAASNNSAVTVRLQSQTSPFVGTLTNTTFDIVAGGNIIIRTTGSGNVGIGTTTVNSRLSLYESTGTTTSTMELATSGNAYKGRFGMFANNFYITSNWYYNGTQNADNLSYGQGSITFGGGGIIDFQTSAAGATSPTTRMSISGSGDVTFGTGMRISQIGSNTIGALTSNLILYSTGYNVYIRPATGYEAIIDSGNGLNVTGKTYSKSGGGSITPSFTTLFTMEGFSTYIITMHTGTGDGTYGIHTAIYDSADLVTAVLSGNNISSQISGTDFQIKSNNGATYGLTWTALRIK